MVAWLYLRAKMSWARLAAGLGQKAAEAVLSSPRWAMAAALDEVDKTHGGIENYLLGDRGNQIGGSRAPSANRRESLSVI